MLSICLALSILNSLTRIEGWANGMTPHASVSLNEALSAAVLASRLIAFHARLHARTCYARPPAALLLARRSHICGRRFLLQPRRTAGRNVLEAVHAAATWRQLHVLVHPGQDPAILAPRPLSSCCQKVGGSHAIVGAAATGAPAMGAAGSVGSATSGNSGNSKVDDHAGASASCQPPHFLSHTFGTPLDPRGTRPRGFGNGAALRAR